MEVHAVRVNKSAVAVLTGLTLLIAFAMYRQHEPPVQVGYMEFLQAVEAGLVCEVVLTNGPDIRFVMEGVTYITDNPRETDFKSYLLRQNIQVREGMRSADMAQAVAGFAFMGGILFFAFRMSKRTSGQSALALTVADAGQDQEQGLHFADVAGNEEAKESMDDLVDFIQNPEKYTRYGARMPRGVLLYGPPGTGKTLMAKAVAGEADVPFYPVSGSDFVQMYVGVGAARVRELFKKAREARKAVIFIDEIDALGKKRGASAAGGNDERDQTLNALLTEMSGFSSGEGIVVMAATNRLDTLDEALLRPGRFDRQIEIGLPDRSARRDILTHHAKNKPMEVSLDDLARQTVYFSGAMLENLLNEAAIFAAKDDRKTIGQDDVDRAYFTIIAGSEKKNREHIGRQERQITAYHESGHALAALMVAPDHEIAKVTIIPSAKGAGGFCVHIPPDKMYYTKKEIEAEIMILLAGRAAEELVFGQDNVTTGGSNDLEKATGLCRDYVTRYGMDEGLGLLVRDREDKDAQEACKSLIERLYIKTKDLLADCRNHLDLIADELLEKESVDGEHLRNLLKIELAG